jgi:hypothetical protein
LLLWCLERVSTSGLYSNSWGRWIDDHLKKGLAKFGYRLKRKVEKFRNPATCWWHTRNYCLYMVTWAHFFQKNPFITFANPFFHHQDATCHPKKQSLVSTPNLKLIVLSSHASLRNQFWMDLKKLRYVILFRHIWLCS